jgi:uncharacterized protein (TIGR02444 family)
MHEPDRAPLEEALWRFSLAFYALPGVAEALIALQDREGRDVNLILFALWLGHSGGGRLDRATLAEAERATRAIREEIVEPLRTLRRELRRHADEDVQRLREEVKALELAAEKLVQTRLARLVAPSLDMLPEARLAAARANLALYLGPEAARSERAAVILAALEACPLQALARPSA